jgi:hypothetical protein
MIQAEKLAHKLNFIFPATADHSSKGFVEVQTIFYELNLLLER